MKNNIKFKAKKSFHISNQLIIPNPFNSNTTTRSEFVKNWKYKAVVYDDLVIVYDNDYTPHLFSIKPHHTCFCLNEYFEPVTPEDF